MGDELMGNLVIRSVGFTGVDRLSRLKGGQVSRTRALSMKLDELLSLIHI